MSKVHIGEKNGRMGFWIAAPGGDASSEGKMLLSSDLDYLKIHKQGRVVIEASFQDVDGQWVYPGRTITFPALPHFPLYWVCATWRGDDFLYPMQSLPNSHTGKKFVGIKKDRLIIDDFASPRSFGEDFVFHYQVFKNKMAD